MINTRISGLHPCIKGSDSCFALTTIFADNEKALDDWQFYVTTYGLVDGNFEEPLVVHIQFPGLCVISRAGFIKFTAEYPHGYLGREVPLETAVGLANYDHELAVSHHEDTVDWFLEQMKQGRFLNPIDALMKPVAPDLQDAAFAW